MPYFPLILLGVTLNAGAQILLKMAMNRIGQFSFSWENLSLVLQQAVVSPYLWLGLTAYAVSVVVWMMALSRVDVSVAYPMLSLGYVMVALVGHFWLQENLTFERIVGIGIIILGVFLLIRTTS